jgi:hypothetical protein
MAKHPNSNGTAAPLDVVIQMNNLGKPVQNGNAKPYNNKEHRRNFDIALYFRRPWQSIEAFLKVVGKWILLIAKYILLSPKYIWIGLERIAQWISKSNNRSVCRVRILTKAANWEKIRAYVSLTVICVMLTAINISEIICMKQISSWRERNAYMLILALPLALFILWLVIMLIWMLIKYFDKPANGQVQPDAKRS